MKLENSHWVSEKTFMDNGSTVWWELDFASRTTAIITMQTELLDPYTTFTYSCTYTHPAIYFTAVEYDAADLKGAVSSDGTSITIVNTSKGNTLGIFREVDN